MTNGALPARLAVLGHPIAHSRSPRIHAAAYRELGLDWRYTAVRCGVDGLAPFVHGRGSAWRGLSVTMPLKEEAYRLAASRDSVATLSGVVNTLAPLPDGGWRGFNTDVAGLAVSIRGARLDATRTVVLGAGATAVSAVLAAQQLGAAHLLVCARRPAAVDALLARCATPASSAHAVSGTPLSHAADALAAFTAAHGAPTLVISTLPGPAGGDIDLPGALLEAPLFDVAYDPWPSPLAERWAATGLASVTAGTEMLVEQALVQVRIFVHGDPDTALPDEARVLAAMRRAAA